MLPEGKLLIHFFYPSRRSGHLVSLYPVSLLAQVSQLSLLHKWPVLPAVLFGHSLWTAVKSITTALRFGCKHGRDKHTGAATAAEAWKCHKSHSSLRGYTKEPSLHLEDNTSEFHSRRRQSWCGFISTFLLPWVPVKFCMKKKKGWRRRNKIF